MPNPNASDKIYSVSELNRLAADALQSGVGAVWVRGEVTGYKLQPSGHAYFSLKDAQGVIQVAFFKGAAAKSTVRLAEGKQILLFGELDIYSPRGSYQMIAKFVLDEGVGKLQQEFERLKKQLTEEGLFARENKIAIPRLPRVVAFVTSPTGAVWHDFTMTLQNEDWRGRVILFPCRVQGAEAPEEIVDCLVRADKHTDVELIVVGRGGGSLEDLWAFNDERVVRAVAAVKRPVVSAVGHETDFTLTDFAADERAPTPTAAAANIAGLFNGARADVENLSLWLQRTVRNALNLAMRHLRELNARLTGRSPRVVIDRAQQTLDELGERMSRAATSVRQLSHQRLRTAAARLQGLDPVLTMARGYVVVQGANGKLLTSAAAVASGSQVELHFADGKKSAKVT